ncbi:phosphohydrolase [Levilactobacillus koreensis JCM 16448]|uniref:Phosphohydrolase n=1 Tax=Levilactobacillus koreensis TaxID=637971 RepID=A0AAC8UVI0_9LACO|nr:metallophosphoesterase [Levilactobacillus koreensis]AKP64174.1 phosphohydrolase [Levilactobacillus koreensis]KRK91554.1 phosphohydrolase [Levilactobacillus koreensis JCM 16448]
MNKFTIVHLSDPQLTAPAQSPQYHQQIAPIAKLQRIFDDIVTHQVEPDLIVVSGDLLQGGTSADYARLHAYFQQQAQRVGAPVQVILGDQDDREAFNIGYLEQKHQPYYAYKQVYQNMDFYFLDSKWEPNKEAGWLEREQLDWLNKNLHLAPRRRAFIFLHHPLDTPALRGMRYAILQNNRELLAILHGHNIGGIFTGHLHFGASYLVDNSIPVTSVGSATTYIDCQDLHRHEVHDGVSYNIITIQRGMASVTTHPLFLGQPVIDTITIGNTGFAKHRPRLTGQHRASDGVPF